MNVLVAALRLDVLPRDGLSTAELVRQILDDGNEVVVLTPSSGEERVTIERLGVPVITDPDDLGLASLEVVHARHLLSAVMVRRRLPTIPLVLEQGDGGAPSEIAEALGVDLLLPRQVSASASREVAGPQPGPAALSDAYRAAIERAPQRSPARDPGALETMSAELDTLISREQQLRGRVADLAHDDRIAQWKIVEKDEAIVHRDRRIDIYEHSPGFGLVRALRRAFDRLAPFDSRRRDAFRTLARGFRSRGREGAEPLRDPPTPRWRSAEYVHYQLWRWQNRLTSDDLRAMRASVEEMSHRPLISVIMPTYNSDPRWLRRAIESVRKQIYPDWEICIADDGSRSEKAKRLLRTYSAQDRRIHVTFLPRNRGISAASNAALALAKGEFIAMLDHDDELAEEALYRVVARLNEEPNLDFIYTDEDHLDHAPDLGADPAGEHTEAFFKPDWSPETFLSFMYPTHLTVFRRSLVESLGGWREGFEGSQDYDLVLRLTEVTDRIGHVPWPVYSWRMIHGSAAASDQAKPWAYEAAKRAIGESLTRRGLEGRVEDGPALGYYSVRYAIRREGSVAIIVPTRDRLDLLRRCIESVRERTTYRNYEVIVVNNQSSEPATLEYLESFGGRVIPYDHPFHYSRMMNEAVEQVNSDYVLMLNNDTEVISDEWLTAMVELGQMPEIGVVGARLFFSDGTPQHEGIVVGPGAGLAANADTAGYYLLGDVIRNVSAVTGACMLLRREVYRKLGGMDERFKIAFNDVDLCLRALSEGYRVVYTPHAELFHEEGGTRGRVTRTHPLDDEELFRARWGDYRDPYYNPNFERDLVYRIRLTSRRDP